MSSLTLNGNGRGSVAIAILLIFSALSLLNNLCYNYLRPAGGSQR
jgi:hypothetical protein